MDSWGADKQFEGNCTPYYRETIVIAFRDGGWDEEILDAGFFFINANGDTEDIRHTATLQKIAKPAMLNGSGEEKFPSAKPVFRKFRYYTALNFNALRLP